MSNLATRGNAVTVGLGIAEHHHSLRRHVVLFEDIDRSDDFRTMDETSNSLLIQIRDGRSEAWDVLIDCYTPFIRAVLLGRGVKITDLDDLVQSVLTVVVRKVPEFERQRTGSFRAWLRSICANCLREQIRSTLGANTAGAGDRKIADLIDELEDPASDLSRHWDAEHDAHVLHHLLQRVQSEFKPSTFAAFQRLAIAGHQVDEVATDLGISVNAAFVARSRVLKRLREIAAGMID